MPPLLIVVNIALDDFTTNNGATEIWPGSHRLVDADAEESKTLRIPEHRYTKLKSTKTLAKPIRTTQTKFMKLVIFLNCT